MNSAKYVGLPFKEKGRDAEGCDCWGLVYLIYKNERNLLLPSYDETYQHTLDKQPISDKIEQEKQLYWRKIPAQKAEPYDVILLKMMGLPMHVGVVTRKGQMLHVMKDINATHEAYLSMRWKSKIMGFYRYVGSKSI